MASLLFIHGASCSARVWQFGFLEPFEAAGHDCHLLDLPGHGAAPERARLDEYGLADYAQAIAAAADALPHQPVLIGHSMGGYLAQRHVLTGGRARAIVLLAAAPPQGMAREAMNFALRHPLLALRLDLAGGQGPRPARLARVRGMLCRPQTPAAVVEQVTDLLQPESRRALRELSLQALPDKRLPVPVCVHGGAHDQLISVAATRAMAARYGVHARIHAGQAHMLPMEPGYQQVAMEILEFLQALP